MIEYDIDAQLENFARALNATGDKVSAKGLARLAKSALRDGRDAYLEALADDLSDYKLPKTKIRRNLRTVFVNAGGSSRSALFHAGWFRLAEQSGLKQTPEGVVAPGWGLHRGTFIATMRSGHRGVFRRIRGVPMNSNPNKEMVRELWGVNPNREVERGNSDALELAADAAAQAIEVRAIRLLASVAG
ncbi:hypothetical protein [Pseudovibrio sp. Tun.PSC04-5.I4]|uniref:hypothetical protein n=1 Tax=Pseudovibrio sp. Tun.PSC04-5.I4 TaxID=1798213 RepID=UPI00088744F0|nr:hypothetical protein [Pseudovibrio sp. Tun.PSC04-5.I4]SDQ99479.1 hypothetical protein SAMN04515695_2224 [Pseudovibrio sp. Tun.PSC04-5.I4]